MDVPLTPSTRPAAADLSADPDCVFCGIVAGDVPARVVYSDVYAVAFLDLTAWHRGHTLVIPRRHVANLLTGTPALAEIAPAIDTVARMLRNGLGAAGVNVLSSAGEVAGQTVFHLHVHVVPRYADEPGLARLIQPATRSDAELDAVHRQITGSE